MRGGWQEGDPSGVNVNVNNRVSLDLPEAIEARRAEQRKLLKLFTTDELLQYRQLMRRAAERQRWREQPAVDSEPAPF